MPEDALQVPVPAHEQITVTTLELTAGVCSSWQVICWSKRVSVQLRSFVRIHFPLCSVKPVKLAGAPA